MKVSGITSRLTLAIALLIAGIPVHGAMSIGMDPTAHINIDETPTAVSGSIDDNCPNHIVADPSPISTANDAETSGNCLDDDCCASDCGCNCVGLSLVIPLKRLSVDLAIPDTGPIQAGPLLDSLITTALLRPPQA